MPKPARRIKPSESLTTIPESCPSMSPAARRVAGALRTACQCIGFTSSAPSLLFRSPRKSGRNLRYLCPSRVSRQSTQSSSIRPTCATVNSEQSRRAIVSSRASLELNDTIYALSSAPGVAAGVAIIRVSGPATTSCLAQLLKLEDSVGQPGGPTFPKPRYATLRKLYHPTTSELLDEAMVLYFPGPRSFTGEDVAEFHVHGSRAVIAGVIEALGCLEQPASQTSVVRPAGRGEFTRRAFENGKMDLTGVEGLADLISAETSEQRNQALRQLGGEIRNTLEGWREELKRCLAHVEAVIDFGDDVDDEAFEDVVPKVADLCAELETHLNDRRRGEIVRGGARIAIVGEPNVGKSTLLNALAQRPAAIVSPHAGTTRDVVEVQLDLNGLAVIVSDTAGLRNATRDPIEIEGIKRAKDVAASADITLLLFDASRGTARDALQSTSLPHLQAAAKERDHSGSESTILCVANKIDLMSSSDTSDLCEGVPVVRTSLVQNTGLSELQSRLERILRMQLGGFASGLESSMQKPGRRSSDVPIITRARHRHHLTAAFCAMQTFVDGRSGQDRSMYLPMDLAAENLRVAAKELGHITGVIHAEEVLDTIFSEFCIGK